MKRRGIGGALLSLAVFGLVLAGLVSVDPRVHETFVDAIGRGQTLSPFGDRAGDLVDAVVNAVRHQSIDNAPLLVFTAVGAVLVVFMVGSSNFRR